MDCIKYKKQIGFSVDYKAERLEKISKLPKGKSNVDFIPNSDEMINFFKTLFNLNKTKGGRSTKGQGVHGNKNRTVVSALKYNRPSYSQLEILINHCTERNLKVRPDILEIFKNYYYYDEIICSYSTTNKVEMMDIEVDVDHSFLYNGAVVHNSQGSTYDNAIVIAADILKNPKIEERNRILYVAFTRAKNNLFIIE